MIPASIPWPEQQNGGIRGYADQVEFICLLARNLHEAGFIANLGTSLTTVQAFLEAARAGATFLILPTPDPQTAERVSQVIHHVPFMLAERYHRLVIEDLI